MATETDIGPIYAADLNEAPPPYVKPFPLWLCLALWLAAIIATWGGIVWAFS